MRTTDTPRSCYGTGRPPRPALGGPGRSRAVLVAVALACALAIGLASARDELPPLHGEVLPDPRAAPATLPATPA